jgi:hypothetical protein
MIKHVHTNIITTITLVSLNSGPRAVALIPNNSVLQHTIIR